MAQIRLRPLAIPDPAGSQPVFGNAYTHEASPTIRANGAVPTVTRGKSLAATPPDPAGTTPSEDTGVSKLRSKLRRLLGASSSSSSSTAAVNSSNNPKRGSSSNTNPHVATLSQIASLRSASSHDLNERPAVLSRVPSSVPISPAAPPPSRGRFNSSIAISPAPSPGVSAVHASVGSYTCPSPSPGSLPRSGSSTGPICLGPTSPSPAAAGGRPPSTGNGSGIRGSLLRRAVSFNPAMGTFPPLGTSSPTPATPGTPQSSTTAVALGSGGPGTGSAAVAGMGGGGTTQGSRPSSCSSAAAAVTTARLSNMVVVPEDEAFAEEPVLVEYASSSHPFYGNGAVSTGAGGGGVAGNSRLGLMVENGLRAGRSSTPEVSDAVLLLQPHADVLPGTVTSSVSVRQSMGPPSPYGGSDHKRSSQPNGGDAENGSTTFGWQYDIANGPFAAATSAATAILTDAAAPALRQTGYKDLAARPESVRRLSSASVGAASASPRAPGPTSPLPGSSQMHVTFSCPALKPATPPTQRSSPSVVFSGGGGGGGSVSIPAPTAAASAAPSPSVPSTGIPGLNRGMSAFNLMPSSVNGLRGVFGTGGSPWNSTAGGGGAAASAATAALTGPLLLSPSAAQVGHRGFDSAGSNIVAATTGPTAHVPTSTSVPAPVSASAPAAVAGGGDAAGGAQGNGLRQAPIRRAFSTLDSSARQQSESSPASAPGVVMALGASMPPEMQRKEWRLEDFTLLKKLYKGNYSSVHKALCRQSMRLVVIKMYDTTRMTELARNHVEREAALHAPLEHENILNLYAVFSQGPYVMLLEEVAEGGDLYHVLKGVPGHRLHEDRAVAGVLAPLLRSLTYLHEQGLCHRDIKLENILFYDRQHTRMLLADFGIALSLRQERAVTRAGTTEYMSPEQLRCPFKRHPGDNKDRTDLHYGLGVDVWATGVLAYELLHGYPPFLGNNREETEALIMAAEVVVAPQISLGARDFVLCCLQKDPAERPTVHQLLQHPWVRQHARQLRAGA